MSYKYVLNRGWWMSMEEGGFTTAEEARAAGEQAVKECKAQGLDDTDLAGVFEEKEQQP